MKAIAGIAVIAAAAILGDFIWYAVGVRHTMTAGILHGALLLATVGAAHVAKQLQDLLLGPVTAP